MLKRCSLFSTIALLPILFGCSTEPKQVTQSPVPTVTPSVSPSTTVNSNPFGLPKASCGDQPSGDNDIWYGVFIDGGDLGEVQTKYCKDAIAITREKTGVASVQVASFTDKAKAEAFAMAVGGEASSYDPNSDQTMASEATQGEEVSDQPISDSTNEKPSNPRVRTTKSGYLAAVTKEDLEQAIKYANQEDEAALEQLISSNRVFPMKEGLEVYIEECAGLMCSIVEIRPVGKTITVFTVAEAISE